MFSNLASYLLGNQSTEVVPEVGFTAIDAEEDDWVLVEKTETGRDEDCDIFPALRNQPETTDCLPLTRTSSTSSLPCLSFEESWFLTPPPCFTSQGPVHMETSPLENLLIEHPSMSVYQHSLTPYPLPRRSGSLPPSSPSSSTSEEREVTPPPPPVQRAVLPAPRRHVVASLQQQQEKQILQLRSAQKLQQRRSYQALKRTHLDRSNKARDFHSRNKVQRRSDHMLHHSGANNNRKC